MARLKRDGTPVTVGSFEIDCIHADCDVVIEVVVTVVVGRDQDGDAVIRSKADVADLWAHEFSHQIGKADGA